MILYIGLTILTILIAYRVEPSRVGCPIGLAKKEMQNRILLFAIFFLLFMVSAFREAVGNDYGEYLNIFRKVSENKHVSSEIGFNLVVKLVQYLFGTGVVSVRIIFALFSFGTVYFFVKALYEQSEWFAASFFLFMTQGFYFNSLNTVRYYFVLAVALYSMNYVIKKKWMPFVCLILFAALFHKSVLLVLPVYFLANLRWKKWHAILVGLGCASLVLFPNLYRKIIFTIYPFYENSAFDDNRISIINVLRCTGVVVLTLLYYKQVLKDNRKNQFYFYLNLGALLIYLFGSFIPEVSRVGYYLSISNVFLIPAVLRSIPKKGQRIFFTIAVVGAFTLYFAVFLYRAWDISLRLLPYRSFMWN